MKRLLFVVLILTCSVSWAEWKFLESRSRGDGDDTLIYYDKSTIKKTGAISRMWHMQDHIKVQTDASGKNYRSAKVLQSYNCREETIAVASFVLLSDQGGSGNVVSSATIQEKELVWDPITPDTIGAKHFKIACGKK